MELSAAEIAEIARGSGPHWLEIAAWISQTLILVALILGAIYAKEQVDHMRKDSDQNLKIAQARLMLELDNRWDSADMQDSRRLLSSTQEDIGKMIASEHPMINDEGRQDKIKEKWCSHLSQIRSQDPASYGKLMSMCGFFETVGLMVARDYISQDDMFRLFLGPILAIDQCFAEHIGERSNETGVPKGLYQHALNLCAAAKQAHV